MKNVLKCLLLVASIFSVNSFAMQGQIRDDRYYSPSRLFTIQLPKIDRGELKVSDGAKIPNKVPEYADFTFGGGYWMIAGYYSVEFRILNSNDHDDLEFSKNFNAINAEKLPKFLNSKIVNDDHLLETPQCKVIHNNVYPAYQCSAKAIVGHLPAMVLATAVNFKDAFAILVGVLPMDDAQTTSIKQYSQDYNVFVNSLRKL